MNKNLIVFLVVVVLAIIAYNLFKNKNKTTSSTTSGSNGSTSNVTNYAGVNTGSNSSSSSSSTGSSTTPIPVVNVKQYVYVKSTNSAPIRVYNDSLSGNYSNGNPGAFVGEFKEIYVAGGTEWYKTTGNKITLKSLSELKGIV